VTVYDEDGFKLAATNSFPPPTEAFTEARKIVDRSIYPPDSIEEVDLAGLRSRLEELPCSPGLAGPCFD
jgi:hypothetical protein